MSERPQRVLFLCIHNSARSQMAEGLLRAAAADRFEAFSAGLEAGSMRPEVIAVMREIGIDVSAQRSKSVNEFAGQPFDIVVTTCDERGKPVLCSRARSRCCIGRSRTPPPSRAMRRRASPPFGRSAMG